MNPNQKERDYLCDFVEGLKKSAELDAKKHEQIAKQEMNKAGARREVVRSYEKKLDELHDYDRLTGALQLAFLRNLILIKPRDYSAELRIVADNALLKSAGDGTAVEAIGTYLSLGL